MAEIAAGMRAAEEERTKALLAISFRQDPDRRYGNDAGDVVGARGGPLYGEFDGRRRKRVLVKIVGE